MVVCDNNKHEFIESGLVSWSAAACPLNDRPSSRVVVFKRFTRNETKRNNNNNNKTLSITHAVTNYIVYRPSTKEGFDPEKRINNMILQSWNFTKKLKIVLKPYLPVVAAARTQQQITFENMYIYFRAPIHYEISSKYRQQHSPYRFNRYAGFVVSKVTSLDLVIRRD